MHSPFEPSDETLKALGRVTFEFARLEYWVNEGILVDRRPKTRDEFLEVIRPEFTRRAKQFNDLLQTRLETSAYWQEPMMIATATFNPSLQQLAEERNLLSHAAAFTKLDKEGVAHPFKYSFRYQKEITFDEATVSEFAEKVRRAAEQAQYAAISLDL